MADPNKMKNINTKYGSILFLRRQIQESFSKLLGLSLGLRLAAMCLRIDLIKNCQLWVPACYRLCVILH